MATGNYIITAAGARRFTPLRLRRLAQRYEGFTRDFCSPARGGVNAAARAPSLRHCATGKFFLGNPSLRAYNNCVL
jgi:hypothetical protein